MYALVDAVSFYASAEKIFDPAIRNRPVVVLTNNDGCICAVCPIARRLGVPKFKPYFQVKNFLIANHVVVRSSNYELYAQVSEKMMNVIARFCDSQHIYSIDESFLNFTRYRCIENWFDYGVKIRRAVWQETRLPVGVGFGSTPTLAKAANHAAKKLDGFNGVAVIDNENIRRAILSRMLVTDVWGIGQRLGKRLNLLGIKTAWQLACQPAKAMRTQFNVHVERTINELNGMVCLNWDEVKHSKKEVFSTRSFGLRVTREHELKSALISHGMIVARKIRKQQSLIKRLLVFAASSPFDNHFYKKSISYDFALATDNSLVITQAIAELLDDIYQPGVSFHRCGVGALDIESACYHQQNLFFTEQNNPSLMACLDRVNQRYGQGTLRIAAEGKKQKWAMKRNFLSPRYVSHWQDIPKIIC